MKENVIEGNKLIAADRVKQLGYVVLDGLKDIWTFYLSVADAEKLIKYLKEQFLLP